MKGRPTVLVVADFIALVFENQRDFCPTAEAVSRVGLALHHNLGLPKQLCEDGAFLVYAAGQLLAGSPTQKEPTTKA